MNLTISIVYLFQNKLVRYLDKIIIFTMITVWGEILILYHLYFFFK